MQDISYGYKYDGLVETVAQGDEVAAAMDGKRLFFHRNHGIILGVENVARVPPSLHTTATCACSLLQRKTSDFLESEMQRWSDTLRSIAYIFEHRLRSTRSNGQETMHGDEEKHNPMPCQIW
jgi:hypothetical protein